MSLTARLPFGALAIALLGTCTTVPAAVANRPAAPALVTTTETSAQTVMPQRSDPKRFAFSGAMIQGGMVIGLAPKGTAMLTLDGVPVPLAPDGRFVIAFDRDAVPGAVLIATRSDSTQVRQQLTISPRAWDISKLDTLPKYPVPQPEYEKRRPAELAQINAARKMQTDAQGWKQPFLWPVTGRISTLFGSQRVYQNGEAGAYHSGVDVARPVGTIVLAPADGVVILAASSPFTLEGYLLMVDHGMGLNSAFMHLSRIDVKVGEHIRRGQPIGLVGMTGRATGPHLHWGMKWRDARIDPLLVAGAMPVAD
jgi:murein DD-endopeptidase MepM/ murein hydrolase activator NlpD